MKKKKKKLLICKLETFLLENLGKNLFVEINVGSKTYKLFEDALNSIIEKNKILKKSS